MKKTLLTLLLGLSILHGVSQTSQESSNIVKLDAGYLLHWFSKNPVSLAGLGFSFERAVNRDWSFALALNYNVRVDDPIKQPRTYADLIFFVISGRRYLAEAPSGAYYGAGLDMGIPKTNATAGDLFVLGGYQIIDDQLSFDLNFQIGYGVLREKINDYWGVYYEKEWGFFVRPGVSIGYVF